MDKDVEGTAAGVEANLPLADIRPNPHQPRKSFEPGALDELKDSIRNHGVLQPVVVRRASDGYELIAGERRWRAAELAGLDSIPAMVRSDVSDEELLELALVENVQRRDLDALEKARGFRSLMDQLSLTQEQVAEKVGLKRATVSNHIRLLELPEEVQEALSQELITMGHARALLGLKSKREIKKALGQVIREQLSVRQTEERVKARSSSGKRGSAGSPAGKQGDGGAESGEPWVTDLQRQMQIHLGARVKIQNHEGYRGRIVVDYHGREDLDRLIQILAPKDEV